MKYFVTKYALSDGIQERELEREPATHGEYAFDRTRAFQSFVVGRDAFESRADAVMAAEQARDKKVVSLQKQIKKLEAMRFDK